VAENRRNAERREGNKSGYKGVHWCNRDQRWIARIVTSGKSIYLGRFLSPEEAHAAYRNAVARHHGEFGRSS
jgi:hypothetical protein